MRKFALTLIHNSIFHSSSNQTNQDQDQDEDEEDDLTMVVVGLLDGLEGEKNVSCLVQRLQLILTLLHSTPSIKDLLIDLEMGEMASDILSTSSSSSTNHHQHTNLGKKEEEMVGRRCFHLIQTLTK